MTKPRKRRPTFSNIASQSVPHPHMNFGDDDSDSSTQNLLGNDQHSSSYTSSQFVDRWLRRSSFAHPRRQSEDDFGVGVPIESEYSQSETASLKSKPSTRRSSIDSSIDDVCMPLDDSDDEKGADTNVWPDVEVLNEFVRKELAEEAHYAEADMRHSVNEAHEAEQTGRLRPKWSVPWKKDSSLQIQNQMRYTYFRDDLPSTIHSPGIAGLLQPGQSFGDLFPSPKPDSYVPSHVHQVAHGVAQGATQGAVQGAVQGGAQNAAHTAAQAAAQGVAQTAIQAVSSPKISAEDEDGQAPQQATQQSAQQSAQQASRAPSNAPSAAPSAPPTAPNTPHLPPVQSQTSLSTANHENISPRSSFLKANPTYPASVHSKNNYPMISPDPHTINKIKSGATSAAPSFTNSDEIGPWWLDINCPTEEEMRVLARTFGIHPLTTEDILLHETHEKVELFHNYYFVCFTSFDVKAWNQKSRYDEEASTNRKRRNSVSQSASSKVSTHKARRSERLKPLAVFSIVFHTGIITVHYRPTAHTINVRRRIRLLRDYLNVTSDWISYALIDDITDGYGPLIASVDEDVQDIEDAILKMHGSRSDSESEDEDMDEKHARSTSSSRTSSTGYREWRRKGNMLRWIGESRKRVMSLLSLLGNKADVIKGFSKRVSEHWSGAPNSEIAMYLSDIQDHLVTMNQSLNHYEKLLARAHSNYLAQLNIDMTRTNNEMNDVLSKITVLGTIVLPINIVTGLWGMNVIVPGQMTENLNWFYGIVMSMVIFAISAYFLLIRLM